MRSTDLAVVGGGIIGLAVALTIVLSVLAVWLFRRRARHGDAARRVYDRFCRALARRGVLRDPAEGPVAFARRAASQLRDRAPLIQEVTELYVAVRYAQRSDLLPELRAAAARF